MRKTPNKYDLSGLTKWLIALALFIGVFSFSGFTIKSNTNQPQQTQSELVLIKNQKSNQRNFLFRKALKHNNYNQNSIFNSTYKMNKFYTNNLFAKIKNYNILRQNYACNFFIRIMLERTIPQSPEDSFFVN
jgi:hypothetical protein